MQIDSKILAIDPTGCGCTDCIVGTYIPLNAATKDHVQAVMLGMISDNTGTRWDIAERADRQYRVTADGREFTISHIGFPIAVSNYTLDLFMDTVLANRVALTR